MNGSFQSRAVGRFENPGVPVHIIHMVVIIWESLANSDSVLCFLAVKAQYAEAGCYYKKSYDGKLFKFKNLA